MRTFGDIVHSPAPPLNPKNSNPDSNLDLFLTSIWKASLHSQTVLWIWNIQPECLHFLKLCTLLVECRFGTQYVAGTGAHTHTHHLLQAVETLREDQGGVELLMNSKRERLPFTHVAFSLTQLCLSNTNFHIRTNSLWISNTHTNWTPRCQQPTAAY